MIIKFLDIKIYWVLEEFNISFLVFGNVFKFYKFLFFFLKNKVKKRGCFVELLWGLGEISYILYLGWC